MKWRRPVWLLAALLIVELSAQVPDSRGRDFWLTFLPNFHNNRTNPDPRLRYGDSLYIFIVADAPCRGVIEWWDTAGQRVQERFQISDPRFPYVFARSWWGLELMGYNDSGTFLGTGGEDETPVRRSFHILVEEGGEVTVYAFQQAVYTSDAFLVLPTDALGTEYLVMSYPSDGRVGGGGVQGSSTPSQCAIVAVEDQTEVTILPSAPTYRNGLREQWLVLNRGDVYLVQAAITTNNLRPDLTGTEIRATKPIAVFAGHQRALIPVTEQTLTSRDMLVEQLPPVHAWGRSALLAHFPEPSTGMDPRGTHRFRVLAAQPNTVVTVNGRQVAVLNRGELYEGVLAQPTQVQASGPILVAAFHKTTNAGGTEFIGDPFMMLIPPQEQFLPRYRFINVQKYSWVNPPGEYQPVYREQYATAIVPLEADLFLDGQPVGRALYRPIGSSGFAYVWLSTTDGVHDIEARFPNGEPAPMGLQVYGYGPADSYGYIGGCSFRPLDISPPTVVAEAHCLELQGTIYDTAATDSRLLRVEVVTAANVQVTIEPFPRPADSVRFQAVLIDPFADGFFQLRARDSSGYESLWDFAIPGFTLRVQPSLVQQELLGDGQQHCVEFQLQNVGSFSKQVRRIEFVGVLPPQATWQLLPPDSVIPPGDRRTVQLCFVASQKGRYTARLLLADSCTSAEDMATVVLIVGADEEPPEVYRQRDSCGWHELLVVTDTLQPASGIAAVEIIEEVNCTVAVLESSVQRVVLQVRVLNPREDAWYELRVRDSAGNQRQLRDTLPGFTVQLLVPADGVLEFGQTFYGELRCDTVWLRNTGHFPVRLENVLVRRQRAFSIPPGQLPLVLPPGEQRGLLVCFAPLTPEVGQYRDTVELGTACLPLSLRVQGELLPQEYSGRDRCGVPLRVGQRPARAFLEQPVPQPVMTEVRLRFGIPEESFLRLALYDGHGRPVLTLLEQRLEAGIYTLVVPLENFPAGLYWLLLRTQQGSSAQPVLIVR